MTMAVCTGNPLSGELGVTLEAELYLFITSDIARKRQKLFKMGKVTIPRTTLTRLKSVICLYNQSQKHYV